jgi:hypothetical protein
VAVYVDDSRAHATVGRISARWSHLTADTEAELHQFAPRLGLRRAWFQKSNRPEASHYDVTDSKRALAIGLGAVPETIMAGAERRRRARAARRGAQLPLMGPTTREQSL